MKNRCVLHADKDFTADLRRPACCCAELRWPDTSQRVESEDGAPAELGGLQPEEKLDLLPSAEEEAVEVEEEEEEGRERSWKNSPALPSLLLFFSRFFFFRIIF